MTARGCARRSAYAWKGFNSGSFDGVSVNVFVCDTELCNGAVSLQGNASRGVECLQCVECASANSTCNGEVCFKATYGIGGTFTIYNSVIALHW